MAGVAQALIMYGDGQRALFYEESNVKINRHGVKTVPMLVVPTEEIKRKFKLKDEDLVIETDDNRKGLWVEYPHKWMDWLNRSKSGAVLLIWCAFDGAETPIMRKVDELLQWDTQRDKVEARLRAQVSLLQRELDDLTTEVPNFHRKQKVIADIYAGKKEDEEGGN